MDNPQFGPRSCDCGTYGDCDCVELPVQQSLGCEITLRGSVCGERWECTGTECFPSCSPRRIRNQTSFVGYLVDSVADGLELWVMSGYEDCPPPGLNGEGEPCTPFVNDDCREGLICFYWGDVLEDCIATCRPFGTECVTETECDSGEVCYNGYCMWCCPG